MAATPTTDRAQLMNAAKELNEFYRVHGPALKLLKEQEKQLRDNFVAAAVPLMDSTGIVYEDKNAVTSVTRVTYSLKKLREVEGQGDLYDRCLVTLTIPSSTLDRAMKDLDVPTAQRDDIKKRITSKTTTAYRLEHAE